MSLFQQPSSKNPGIPQIPLKSKLPLANKTILPLPEEYKQVTPIIPHAQKQNLPMSATHSLLPLLEDCAHTTATIRHCMNIIRRPSRYLNSGQIPIITVDEPLFAIAKQIQWTWDNYDDSKFIIILGGLHIAMTALKCLGKFLLGNGWTTALTQAGVTIQGSAESFLNGSHVKKTCHAMHEVPVCALHILKVDRNKIELFNFLTAALQQIMIPEGKELYVTPGTTIIKRGASNASHTSIITDCNHAEADTRIFVHVAHAAETGHYFCPLHPYFS